MKTTAVALVATVGMALAPQTVSAAPTVALLTGDGPDYSYARFAAGSASATDPYVPASGPAAWPADDYSPDVQPSGPLTDSTEEYLREGVFAATISATDEGDAGVASITLIDGHGRPIGSPVNAPGCFVACPERFTATFRIDVAELADGPHDVIAVATDAAGNSNDAVVKGFYVDTVGPGPPRGIREDEYRSDTDESVVRWVTPNDPDLPGGSLGSGSAASTVRYRVGSGPFTRWRLAENEELAVPAADGEQVTVEIRARDARGNAGPSASVSYAAGSSELP